MASKKAPAVPRRLYADFCNKICQLQTNAVQQSAKTQPAQLGWPHQSVILRDVARTPAGKAMFQMMGVFAEFERSMLRERVYAGLARARVEGIQLGRPAEIAGDAAKVKAMKAARAPEAPQIQRAQVRKSHPPQASCH
jgi:hypothetical protein